MERTTSGRRPLLSRLYERVWARRVLLPTSRAIPCSKTEARVPHGSGCVQLWGQSRDGSADLEANPALVVLRLLGARGRAELATEDPANRLSGVPYVVWTINPPGFGGSSGPSSIQDYMSAVRAARDFLAARYPNARLWIYGKSIGATAAMYLAAHSVLSGLILKNIIDVPTIASRRIAGWLPPAQKWLSATIPTELNPAHWAPAVRYPTLFVISADDQIAPADTQERIAGLYGGPRGVLRVQGGHDEPTLRAEDEIRYAESVTTLWRGAGT
jgi:dienelactone hydrolase